MSKPEVPLFRLILIPALLTLVVTGVRLWGELQDITYEAAGRPLFSREAGGGFALIGIAWLVIPFGLWFGVRLWRSGRGPGHRGRALLLHVLGIAVMVGVFALSMQMFDFETDPKQFVPAMIVNSAGALIASVFAWAAWPKLFGTNLLYGLLARIPVVVITFVAVSSAWGTHYEKMPPGVTPPAAMLEHQILLSVPQLTMWIGFTVLVGGLFGCIGAFFAGRRVA